MEKPNYYSIIPANVRYDKELMANAKLLYGEITALCNENGICWAGNEYFANLYKVSKETISRWIGQLRKKGYINEKIFYKNNSKEIDKRVISIVNLEINPPIDENVNTYCQKNQSNTLLTKTSIGYPQKNQGGIDKNVKENITSINNNKEKYNKKKNEYKYYGENKNVFFTKEQYEKLIKIFPKDYKERIEKLDDYMQSSGKKYKDCLATLRNWARKEGYKFPKEEKEYKVMEISEDEYIRKVEGGNKRYV